MSSITRKFQQPQIPKDEQYNESIIREYQANLRVFLEKVDEQVSELICKYEGQIKKLKRQNTSLRQKLNRYQTSSFSNPQQFRQTISEFKIQNISPIKTQKNKVLSKRNNFNGNTGGKSDFFGRSNLKSYLEYEADDLSSSRFEVEKNKKKMQQQNILSSLEAGKTNLGLNTSKMFDLLGKSQTKNQLSESEQEEQEVKSTEEKKPSLNASLSSACESLDNSFHGKRSKKKNELKRKQKQRIKQMRLQQARKHFKDRKQQGLKNLLKTIRQNVSSTQQKPPQPLKSVKIASSAYETNERGASITKKQSEGNRSKVLIDPNPVDIQKNKNRYRNKQKSKLQLQTNMNMNMNSQKKPISILKSNSNILSKSLLNSSSSLN